MIYMALILTAVIVWFGWLYWESMDVIKCIEEMMRDELNGD